MCTPGSGRTSGCSSGGANLVEPVIDVQKKRGRRHDCQQRQRPRSLSQRHAVPWCSRPPCRIHPCGVGARRQAPHHWKDPAACSIRRDYTNISLVLLHFAPLSYPRCRCPTAGARSSLRQEPGNVHAPILIALARSSGRKRDRQRWHSNARQWVRPSHGIHVDVVPPTLPRFRLLSSEGTSRPSRAGAVCPLISLKSGRRVWEIGAEACRL